MTASPPACPSKGASGASAFSSMPSPTAGPESFAWSPPMPRRVATTGRVTSARRRAPGAALPAGLLARRGGGRELGLGLQPVLELVSRHRPALQVQLVGALG